MTTAFPHDNDRQKTRQPRPQPSGSAPAASSIAGPDDGVGPAVPPAVLPAVANPAENPSPAILPAPLPAAPQSVHPSARQSARLPALSANLSATRPPTGPVPVLANVSAPLAKTAASVPTVASTVVPTTGSPAAPTAALTAEITAETTAHPPTLPAPHPAATPSDTPAPAPAVTPAAATALHAAPETAAPAALFAALRLAAALAFGTALLAGCAVGPDYVLPDTAMPAAYKEDSLWKTAKPADEYPRGQWWRVFHDAELDRLMERLNRQNLSIAQAEAQYRQAEALLRQAESALFPSLTLDAGRTRGALSGNSSALSTRNQAIGTLSWEVDLWGGIRRNVEAGEAGAAASLAQLEAIRLSQQAQLATAYLELIVTDRQIAQLQESEKLLAESLKLTQNQYNAGLVSDASVAQAESQLKVAQAATIDAKLARVRLEHAIAVSIGEPPAALALPGATEAPYLPQIPAGLPSTLLQRRPDIAAAERRVAEANALIGVAQSAFFPSLTLSATGGWSGPSFGNLFTVPNRIWSIGPAIALSVFDAGLRRAQTDEAIAVYDETVAAYRQQVLTAFQEVEDNLAAQAMLDDESALQSAAVAAARRSEAITLNQYRAGIVGYLELLVAQTSRIAAENTLWDIKKRQFAASVALIAAIGGQWGQGEEGQPGEGQTQGPQPEQGEQRQTPSTALSGINGTFGTPEAAGGKTGPDN